MGKRFSRYDFALEVIRTNNDLDTPTNAPSNTPLEQYQKYKKGDFVPTYERDENSLPEKILSVGILPFGVALEGSSEYLVPFSKRTKDFDLPAVLTACNHVDPDPGSMVEAKGFIPAKAIITVPGTGAETEEESQITGRKYRKIPKRSFTYPYGKDTTNSYEAAVREDILSAATENSENNRVTFSSERL